MAIIFEKYERVKAEILESLGDFKNIKVKTPESKKNHDKVARALDKMGVNYNEIKSRASDSSYIEILPNDYYGVIETDYTHEQVEPIFKIRFSDHDLPSKYINSDMNVGAWSGDFITHPWFEAVEKSAKLTGKKIPSYVKKFINDRDKKVKEREKVIYQLTDDDQIVIKNISHRLNELNNAWKNSIEIEHQSIKRNFLFDFRNLINKHGYKKASTLIESSFDFGNQKGFNLAEAFSYIGVNSDHVNTLTK